MVETEMETNFNLIKEINNKKYVFGCKAKIEIGYRTLDVRVKNEELNIKMRGRLDIDAGIIYFDDKLEIGELKITGFRIDSDTQKFIKEWFEKEMEEFKKKMEEAKKKEEAEFQQFLQDNNYYKKEVKILQLCDSGEFGILGIENEKIRKFTNKALDIYLAGVISEGWYPDYYIKSRLAIFTIDELIKQRKARKVVDEEGKAFLILDADVINQIVNMLKQNQAKWGELNASCS